MSKHTDEYHDQDDNRPLTVEEQRARLRQLIIMGKERGYITYSEINDALPDDMSDADQIDNIVSMISGLGIQVTEQAPDAEDILLSDNAATITDDDAVEEAEAAFPSFPRRREIWETSFIDRFLARTGLDFRLRGNDEARISYLKLLYTRFQTTFPVKL